MVREEFDMLSKEQQDTIINNLLESTEKKGTWWHFKPSYAFQCAEADLFVTEDNEAEIAEEISRVIRIMMATAPEQPDSKVKVEKTKSKGPRATPSQLALLDKLKVKYDKNITAKEASVLIDKYFEERQ